MGSNPAAPTIVMNKNLSDKVEGHIFFSGNVQGVGFRYSVQRFAADMGLCGWVRNLSDGRVEVQVEGQQADIDRLVQSVERQFDGYIRDKEISYKQANGQNQNFRIIF